VGEIAVATTMQVAIRNNGRVPVDLDARRSSSDENLWNAVIPLSGDTKLLDRTPTAELMDPETPITEDNWQERALCAQTDPEAFFPEKGGSTRDAKRICLGCVAKDACLKYALDHDERFGIWGGLSERERRRLKRGII
jgi:hypothetical protein